jgi:hypothetical protein
MAENPDVVFISYAREDIEAARRLYEELSSEGLNVWFDVKSLLPGQEWKIVINKIIRDSRFFLAILSSNSINKKGYVQKEIKEALEVADEMPPSSIFIIPILLERCEIPYPRLADFQYVDMSTDWDDGLRKILLAIRSLQKPAEKSYDFNQQPSILKKMLLAIRIFQNLAEKSYDISQKSSHEHEATGFDINNATEILNQSYEFYCKQFHKESYEESWLIVRPILIAGKEEKININITIRYDTNEIIFVMPLYGDGQKGLVGENVESFYNLIHTFNSRTNGGFFTKYTYDDTYAPVFMHHLPLSKMDIKWFKSTLDYFVNIHIAFRSVFDEAISDYGLIFRENAAKEDPVKNYWLISKTASNNEYYHRGMQSEPGRAEQNAGLEDKKAGSRQN